MIINVKTPTQIRTCRDIAEEHFLQDAMLEFPADRDALLQNLHMKFDYFRAVVDDDGKIRSWLAAMKGPAATYSSVISLNTFMMMTGCKGRKAINDIADLHEDMYEFACERRIEAVVSSSHTKGWRAFNRLLSKLGWGGDERICVRMTPSHRVLSGSVPTCMGRATLAQRFG